LQMALAENGELTQAAVARALEVDRSVIHRQLKGEENLTLSRVAELAWALGKKPEFILKPIEAQGNHRQQIVPAAVTSAGQKTDSADYLSRPSPSRARVQAEQTLEAVK
jgi:hypothetical protein